LSESEWGEPWLMLSPLRLRLPALPALPVRPEGVGTDSGVTGQAVENDGDEDKH
jgi:hypothetical protein